MLKMRLPGAMFRKVEGGRGARRGSHRLVWMLLGIVVVGVGALSGAAGAAPGDITVVSTSDTGEAADLGAGVIDISGDGMSVVMGSSNASNLDPAPQAVGILAQVYKKDLSTGDTSLVSASAAGAASNRWVTGRVASSADLGKVAFDSLANNLSPLESDPFPFCPGPILDLAGLACVRMGDVYVKDTASGAIELASRNASNVKGDRPSTLYDLSDDGSTVAFWSKSTNLGAGTTCTISTSFNPQFGDLYSESCPTHLYARNLNSGWVRLGDTNSAGVLANVPVDEWNARGSVSGDGRFVVFKSQATNLHPADSASDLDVFKKDLVTGDVDLLTPADNSLATAVEASFSSDLGTVAYFPNCSTITVKDLSTGTVIDTIEGQPGQCFAFPSLSQDGSKLAFASYSSLSPLDDDSRLDVYLRDRTADSTELASTNASCEKAFRPPDPDNLGDYVVSTPANGRAIANDGTTVAFNSNATNLGVSDPRAFYFQGYIKHVAPCSTGPVDVNGDGIVDSLQPAGTAAGSFSDSSLSPPTSGTIVNSGGLTITITDAANAADGVEVSVAGATGQATLSVCGGFTLRIAAGSTVTITCGSVHVKVTAGSAEIVLAAGLTAVSVPTGGDAIVSNTGGGTYSVRNLSSTVSIGVTVDGVQGTIAPGTTNAKIAAWRFIGFAQPVDNNGVLNNARAGRVLPLKWQLLDANNNPVTNLLSAKVSTQSLTCINGTATDDIEQYSAGSSGLQNLGGGYYQLNWQTPNSYAGSCKTMLLDIGDGVSHKALFRFTK